MNNSKPPTTDGKSTSSELRIVQAGNNEEKHRTPIRDILTKTNQGERKK